MTTNYDGASLLDSEGQKVGSIDRTYIDDTGAPRFLAVKTGTILTRHHLVPADRVNEVDTGLQVPYLKTLIEESPTVDTGDTLEGEQLDAVRSYYANNGSLAPTTPTDEYAAPEAEQAEQLDPDQISAIGDANPRNRPASDFPEVSTAETPAGFGEVRDLGDVIEVPIIEEVMVKKAVVREVLRIRKSHITETGTAAADLRREEIEVAPSGEGLLGNREANESVDSAR